MLGGRLRLLGVVLTGRRGYWALPSLGVVVTRSAGRALRLRVTERPCIVSAEVGRNDQKALILVKLDVVLTNTALVSELEQVVAQLGKSKGVVVQFV